MTRPSREPVLAPLLGAVVAVLLSGCVVTTSPQLAGPGMMVRTGQGSVRCSDRAPVVGTRVDVILMDPGRRTMTSGAALGRMPFHAGSMGASMRVRMMLVAAPHVVPAGQVTLVAVNRGARTHELSSCRLIRAPRSDAVQPARIGLSTRARRWVRRLVRALPAKGTDWWLAPRMDHPSG